MPTSTLAALLGPNTSVWWAIVELLIVTLKLLGVLFVIGVLLAITIALDPTDWSEEDG